MLWLGAFMIEAIVGPNTFYLSHLDGEKIELLVNKKYLKPNNCVLSYPNHSPFDAFTKPEAKKYE